MKTKIENIPNESSEYFTICINEENNTVSLHIGYYEAELNNKQIDFLIKALKHYKTHKGV